MPKYVRTKDGTIYGNGGFILEIEKLNLNKIVGNIKYEIIDNKLVKTMYGYEAHIFEYDIIDKSNNLTELCDEFVQTQKCFGGEIKYWILPKLEGKPIETVMEGIKYHLKDGNIFGCIWTDKGLIYVAKMNKDGVLCLI